jgi:hypothetical protein
VVFREGEETLRLLKGLNISAKQIERVCHHYGQQIEEQEQQRVEKGEDHIYPEKDRNDLHYAMMDGAMYFTREDQWKEAKIGRVFKGSDNVKESKNRGIITSSIYVSHLGSSKEFFPKLEYYLNGLSSLVIIADGAKWIWNWANTYYPEATQILDFYHAKEHLCEFAINYFSDNDQRTKWIDLHCENFLKDNVNLVIESIKKLPISSNKKTEQQRQNLIGYYEKNEKRMKYGTYCETGLLIGSGAIEAAHRNVLQQRMKLSGQRWTNKGFQQISNLRVAYKSDMSVKIKELIKNAA